ncbi:MAG TPA: hypothetical protein PKI59_09185, partial [Candidatus Cloacimonadota bacterium]|nr:hypothetical protein [Candidatus Cloacimonadota bacterium]
WGRDEHLAEIKRVMPVLVENGILKCSDLLQATKTPSRSKKLGEQTGIPKETLRILNHDIELWLPKPVSLDEIQRFGGKQDRMDAFFQIDLADQLAVISTGQTPSQREELASRANLDIATVDEIVKLCDYCRTGKNLQHIRAKIYYEMGMDTWLKWAEQDSAAIIAMFAEYIQKNNLNGERLLPWPKEVRNGIEWAKMRLEIYAVQW